MGGDGGGEDGNGGKGTEKGLGFWGEGWPTLPPPLATETEADADAEAVVAALSSSSESEVTIKFRRLMGYLFRKKNWAGGLIGGREWGKVSGGFGGLPSLRSLELGRGEDGFLDFGEGRRGCGDDVWSHM